MIGWKRSAAANGIDFLSLSIPDRGIPTSLPGALALMARMASALDTGKNVAVHCRQGIGRSGLIAAGILAISGISAEQAIRTVSAARGLTVPETNDQRLWIQGLPVRPSVASQ